jgi:hypothetical protein
LAIVFRGGANACCVRGSRQILRAILSAGAGRVCDHNAVVGISADFDYSKRKEQEQRSHQRYFQQSLASLRGAARYSALREYWCGHFNGRSTNWCH